MLRGNGAVTVGETVEEATVLCWCLEDAARVEIALSPPTQLATVTELSPAEAKRRTIWDGGLLDRMWDFLTRDDPDL